MMRDGEKSMSTIPGAKQEAYLGDQKALLKASSSSTSSRHWSSAGFRNPRIVRVSRTFGGKDRHSKVCTVRGLRDRRIRLSVPTAIELYDLQDRLGLSQPSKVIDWLIDNTKTDIDRLPPLQFPQGSLLSSSSTQFLDHHHRHSFNDQDQFSQKLLGMLPYNSNISPSLSLASHHPFGLGQLSLPQGLIDGSNSSTALFNSNNNNNNNNNNAQYYYPHQYIANHDPTAERSSSSSSSSSSSRMIINQHHQIQLLRSVSNSTPIQNTSSSLLFPNNFSLMSSIQNSSTTINDSSTNNNNSLFKSFPAIFNPGFLSFGNRGEKEDQS